MCRSLMIRAGIAGLLLAGAAGGATTTVAMAQDAPVAEVAGTLVGAWQNVEDETLYLFDADGGYTIVAGHGPIRSGRYEVLTDGDDMTIRLGTDGFVSMSNHGGYADISSIALTPEAAADASDTERFIHASAANPRPYTGGLMLEGSWILQGGSGIATFDGQGGGSLLMLADYSHLGPDWVGTRTALTYKFVPTEGGGLLTMSLRGDLILLQVAAFGRDVLIVGNVPAGGPDPDALRAAGGVETLVRIIDGP